MNSSRQAPSPGPQALSARIALLVVWIAVLAALGWYVQKDLVIGTDLRLFLPSPTTPEQRLLLDEIGEGPASRVLVVTLDGDTPENLAEASRELVSALSNNERFRVVTNGEMSFDAIPEELLAYRYLLSPTLGSQPLDARFLSEQLQTRVRDLGSPAGTLLEPLLPRDPTLEILKLVQSWQPMQEPNRLYDVWFDAKGERALLIAETTAPAFDPDQQRVALDELQRAFATINVDGRMRLTASGPGSFSVLMESRTRGEAQTLGVIATVGMILLLLIAYRRISTVIVSSLPLATAGIIGLLAVSLLFDAVHGITLAFGFTLIGVAQDYPMHLLSHARPNRSTLVSARELWPTLATGVASTCIAYATFWFSGVTGLAQLACFTVASLAAAGLTTRFLLPRLIGPATQDFGDSQFLANLWQRIASLPRPRWAGILLIALCVGSLAIPGPMWENDLSKLTPVPQDLLMKDQGIRGQLGTPDLRYLMVVETANDNDALRRLEQLDSKLSVLKQRGAISGYDHAARYLPSREVQIQRQRKLPDDESLRTSLTQALEGTPFRADVFEPFIEDVARARELPPLTVQALRDSALGATFDLLLGSRDGKSTAIITFTDVKDPAALQQLASQESGALLLDLKAASESLVAKQRSHLLWSLGIAAILLVLVVAIALRDTRRVLRVLAPMALTTLILLAILHGSGIALNLFHLIALILAAGLGLDYALFFEHAADDPHEQRRTLHAVLVCSLSTLMVFALLGTSSLPVLRAIGLTVSLGVISNFVLALLLTREGVGREARGTGKNEKGFDPSPESHAPSPLAALIPHQGSMCLLERVIDWDQQRIRLETDTHRSPENPLRSQDELKALHLCEYGAQAMAVHGALQAQQKGTTAPPGMLVALRSVTFHCERIDLLPGSLVIEAECLQSSASSQQYAFKISHASTLLCEGRAAVVLKS
jgi:predicted exporter/predicted hotdog family 3-hydroxylacyl-ACP dehydratase